MSDLSPRARAAQARAAKRWYVYLILCRSGAVYAGIARNAEVRYAQHVAGTGARYTHANPPRRLLVKFACVNQSEAGRMEAAIKKLVGAAAETATTGHSGLTLSVPVQRGRGPRCYVTTQRRFDDGRFAPRLMAGVRYYFSRPGAAVWCTR